VTQFAHSHKIHHEENLRKERFRRLWVRFLLLGNAVLLAIVVGELFDVFVGAVAGFLATPLTRVIELLGEAGADAFDPGE
jgi:hypothetical protein